MSIVMLHFRRSQKLIEQLAGQSTNPFGPVRPRGPGRGVSTWPECQGALVLASKSRRTGRHRPRMRRYRGSCNPGQTIPGANNDAIRTCWPSQIHESPVLVRSLLNRQLSVTRTCSARRASSARRDLRADEFSVEDAGLRVRSILNRPGKDHPAGIPRLGGSEAASVEAYPPCMTSFMWRRRCRDDWSF